MSRDSSTAARAAVLSSILALVCVTGSALAQDAESRKLTPATSPIVNGVLDHGSPSVGMFLTDRGTCTGTLIGCRTFLTAAHCVCEEGLTGAQCQARADLLDPSTKAVFFQHVGPVGVSQVTVHPSYAFGTRSDLAVLRLASPVPGIRPSRINQSRRTPFGTPGLIVGFGRTGGASQEVGLKRAGLVETASCKIAPGNSHVCWDFLDPIGGPGFDSSTCQGDSGGPLFVDLGNGPVLAGVTSGGAPSCLAPNNPWDADVFVDRAWIASVAGADLHRSDCGTLAFAGEPGGAVQFGSGTLSAGTPDRDFQLTVPPGLAALAVTMNSASSLDGDLFVRRGARPTDNLFDCKSEFGGPLPEVCTFPNPTAGTWHLRATRFDGAGEFQVIATLYQSRPGGGSGDPAPPAGPWLASADLPGFETKVLINDTQQGTRESRCIAETLCVSGALEGRPEAFVKVIGPRPNGFYWAQVSRFTPSKLEIWLRQTSSGQVNYYLLEAVGATDDNVSGLQDRQAFQP